VAKGARLFVKTLQNKDMKFEPLKISELPLPVGYFRTGPLWPEWGRQLEFLWASCRLERLGDWGVFEGVLQAPILQLPSIESQWLPDTLRIKTQWWHEEGKKTTRGFRVQQESSWGDEETFKKVALPDIKKGWSIDKRERLPLAGRLRLDMEVAYLTQQQERVHLKWAHHWEIDTLPEGTPREGQLEDDGF